MTLKISLSPVAGATAGCLFCALAGCARLEERPPSTSDTTAVPLVEFEDSLRVDVHDGSRLAWVLNTRHLVQRPQGNVLAARPVHMVIFDSLENEAAWVDADSGEADEAMTFVEVWGNVAARSQEGLLVHADSLRWSKRTNKVETQGWVRVVSPDGDTLAGAGFTSDDRLENWKIHSSVRSVIQKVEQRVQEAEEGGDSSQPATP